MARSLPITSAWPHQRDSVVANRVVRLACTALVRSNSYVLTGVEKREFSSCRRFDATFFRRTLLAAATGYAWKIHGLRTQPRELIDFAENGFPFTRGEVVGSIPTALTIQARARSRRPMSKTELVADAPHHGVHVRTGIRPGGDDVVGGDSGAVEVDMVVIEVDANDPVARDQVVDAAADR